MRVVVLFAFGVAEEADDGASEGTDVDTSEAGGSDSTVLIAGGDVVEAVEGIAQH